MFGWWPVSYSVFSLELLPTTLVIRNNYWIVFFHATRLSGTSGPCDTFGSLCLAHDPEFELKNVEVRLISQTCIAWISTNWVDGRFIILQYCEIWWERYLCSINLSLYHVLYGTQYGSLLATAMHVPYSTIPLVIIKWKCWPLHKLLWFLQLWGFAHASRYFTWRPVMILFWVCVHI